MKPFYLIVAVCFYNTAFAQSPSLSVLIKMDLEKNNSIDYRIEMKICEPVTPSPNKNYFDNERSSINFKALSDTDIVCGKYTSTYNTENEFNGYQYSNQVFAWEKLLVWKITNESSRDWKKPMFLVLPVKLKSFVTHIEITDVAFQQGNLLWLADDGKLLKNKRQQFNISVKDRKGIALTKADLKIKL